jgi:phenylalanyl-tRNA synthetase beta chain
MRAMELLREHAGARVADGAIDVRGSDFAPARIRVRTERVNQLLGTSLTDAGIREYLTPLGIAVDGGTAVVPTFRPDITREIDLVEEVARRIGLDRITRTVPSNPEKIGGLDERQRARRAATDALLGAGYDEVYTLPLVASADLERAGVPADGVVEVENPLRAEESVLRPSLLPGLLRAAAHNSSHGKPDVALFETGTVFAPPSAGQRLPDERFHLAFVRSHLVRRAPFEPDRPADVYDATAALGALVAELRVSGAHLDHATIPGFHPARGAHVLVDDAVVGAVGQIATAVVEGLDLAGPVVAAELDLGALVSARQEPRTARPISRFPASTIDLAFVVADTVPAGDVEATLRRSGGDVLERVDLFDVFRSDALGAGRVSLAFSVRFRAPDRTLTDDEVGRLRRACIDAVAAAHNAQLR